MPTKRRHSTRIKATRKYYGKVFDHYVNRVSRAEAVLDAKDLRSRGYAVHIYKYTYTPGVHPVMYSVYRRAL